MQDINAQAEQALFSFAWPDQMDMIGVHRLRKMIAVQNQRMMLEFNNATAAIVTAGARERDMAGPRGKAPIDFGGRKR
jgi:hypothetical protein